MTNLGIKIRELRKRKDISQEVLAEALCVSFQAVSKWETGAALPDVTLIPAIAFFFDVTTDELFDYDRYKANAKIEEIVCKAADLRSDEAATICRSLIEATTDDAVKYDALRILAEIYASKGELVLCEETLEKIPEIYFTKLELVAELLNGEKSLEAAKAQFGLDFDSAIFMLSIIRKRAWEGCDVPSAETYRKSAAALIAALKAVMPEFFERGFRAEVYRDYEKEFSEQ